MLNTLIRNGHWALPLALALGLFSGGAAAWADDCNGNGIQDDQDIADGFSEDCNANGVPDECDIDSATSLDCQPNGMPDECELAAVNGLAGAYYDDLDFQGPVKGRIDTTIEFPGVDPWPGLGLGGDTFSVRWTGYVLTPSIAGEYTFFTNTDDGVRLWVDSMQLVDKWVIQGSTEYSGTITLDADGRYRVIMEYYEYTGGERAELRWEPPGQAKEIIPSANLIPGFDCNTNGIPDDCDIATGTSEDLYLNGVPDECEVLDCNGNGVPDDQDIAGETSQDCNSNDVPDECEITWGWVSDCDESGIPDECEGIFGTPLLYVDENAIALGNGTSWEDAFTELRTAMCMAAVYPVVQEIRVAGGTYAPAPFGGERSSTFQLLNNVALYGGYAGSANPADPNDRNIALYETILSGDLDGDDDLWNNRDDNCYHVVTASNTDDTPVLDGFSITGGYANVSSSVDASGAGALFSYGSGPTVSNCRFYYNRAVWEGAGMYVRHGAAPAVISCTFENNWADWGGGGINFPYTAPQLLHNCAFIGNQARHGGGVYFDHGTTTITNCLFSGNTTTRGGSALGFSWFSDGTVVNCTIVGNHDRDFGAVDAYHAQPTLTNCIVWGNTSDVQSGEEAQLYAREEGTIQVDYTCVEGWTGALGGTGNFDADPLLVRNPDDGGDGWSIGDANDDYGDLHLQDGSPCVNTGNDDATGLPVEDIDGDMRVQQCRVDIGADETPYYGDCNTNGVADACDIDTNGDCNTNGIPDDCDVDPNDPDGDGLVSPDLNDNGIPDECEIPVVRYVNDDATGANDGTSWTDAFTDLQDALAIALPTDQIWVAVGTYLPAGPAGDRSATFALASGVSLLGGFDGTETSLVERAGFYDETVLSGDLNGDDDDWNYRDDNSYHVVMGNQIDSTAVLDGFMITAGYASSTGGDDRYGAGLYLDHGDPVVSNCVFYRNRAVLGGGGMRVHWDSDPQISDCAFIENWANNGGAAVCTWSGTSGSFERCAFIGNHTTYDGSAIDFSQNSPSIIGCIFSGNVGNDVLHVLWSSPAFINCSVSGNHSHYGAFSLAETTLSILNCIVWGNTSDQYSGELAQICENNATVTVSHCCVEGWTGTYLGDHTFDADPLFVRNPDDGGDGWNIGDANDDYGDLHLQDGSPCVNVGDNDVVGLPAVDYDSQARIQYCQVDIGADETPYFRDCNTNGTADACDIDGGTSQDCNVNYIPDECDILSGTSEDLNGNGVPDECEMTWYVNDDATGANNGTSWADAFINLQDALVAAQFPDQVWVAAGSYAPAGPGGDRSATFTLVSGVSLLGGFEGTETSLAERVGLYDQTILSGDLNGDDGSTGNGENSYHVITASSIVQATILDGFTISAGNADGSDPDDDGGALRATAANLTIANCTFTDNAATDHGGAVYADGGGALQFSDCVFEANVGDGGGGLWIDGVATGFDDCSFAGNTAEFGAGADIVGDQPLSVIGCEFTDNIANNSGGGLLVSTSSSADVLNSTFTSNVSFAGTAYGGGGMLVFSGDVTVTNCVFAGNTGTPNGGAILAYGSNTTFAAVNCTVNGNTAPYCGGIWASTSPEPATLTNCVVWGNQDGGGMDESAQVVGSPIVFYSCIQGLDTLAGNNNIGDDPVFLRESYAELDDPGDLHLACSSPCIDTGTNATDPPLPDFDLEGSPRILNGVVDMGAYEGSHQAFVMLPNTLSVPEGDVATFTVALACDPQGTVEVTVSHEAGDADIYVTSGGTLSFDSQNYAVPQTVTLGANEDADYINGTATIRGDAEGLVYSRTIAREVDSDPPPSPGALLVGGANSHSVVWKDEYSGTIAEFVPGFGNMVGPGDVVFGPDGHLYVAGAVADNVVRYDGQTGEWIDTFVPAGEGGLDWAEGLIFGPAGDLYVCSAATDEVLRYDGQSGAFLGAFVTAGSGGLDGPVQLRFGAAGNLYVSSAGTDEVMRYDGETGAFIDVFVSAGLGGLDWPDGLVFGPDSHLYVSSAGADQVLRYNGQTGAFIDIFVTEGDGGLDGPNGLVFGSDGNLYVAGNGSDNVLRYDGTTGAFIDEFVIAGSGGLDGPRGIVFGSGGDLYTSSYSTHQILRYDGTSGDFVEVFAGGGSGGLNVTKGLVYGPDENLYVSSSTTDEVLRYDGYTGGFIDAFVPAGSGGLGRPRGLTFGPDGVLYVASLDTSSILQYDGQTGAYLGEFVATGVGGMESPQDLVFRPDGYLYVSDYYADSVHRYDAADGSYVDDFIPPGSGGLNMPVGLTVGPDGNWYVASANNVLRFSGVDGTFMDEFIPMGSGGLLNPSGVLFGSHGNLYVSDFDGNNVLRYYGPTGEFLDEFIPADSAGLRGPQRMVWMPDFGQPGDFDDDGDVDLDDFADWDDCMTGPDAGPYGEGCRAFDFDHDNDVDMVDFAAFQRAFSQP